MARQLWYRNVALGTHFIAMPPSVESVSPAAVMPGIFQNAAAVSSLSRNLLYKMTLHIALKATDEIEFAEFAVAIQGYANIRGGGLLEVKDGSTVRMRWRDAVLIQAGEPSILDGFGGRFTADWPLVFVGSAAPEFY